MPGIEWIKPNREKKHGIYIKKLDNTGEKTVACLLNLCLGQDVIVMGNGPSLDCFDLSKAKDYFVIGTNQSYRAYSPDIILYVDEITWEKLHNDMPAKTPKVAYWCGYSLPNHIYLEKTFDLLWNGIKKMPTYKNAGLLAIKLASHMGAKRIITCGIDMGIIHGKSYFNNKKHILSTGQEQRAMRKFYDNVLFHANNLPIDNVYKCHEDSYPKWPVIDFFPRKI